MSTVTDIHNVIVVGSGPAGRTAALRTARRAGPVTGRTAHPVPGRATRLPT
jgi:thioredoxin reductase